jgi:hypothetical protein
MSLFWFLWCACFASWSVHTHSYASATIFALMAIYWALCAALAEIQ